ncbi:hypothetical protein BN59_01083 [Legionella massiliensis]|uniref:Uncharacterized protein n=1 Tax=Legionella massiliensis TaxID=1034943 RepID=A0A078KUY4_9GAMM|nr:hypothetical protein [Legionella massiliensis]CDZ76807.1 hypothetical protein BN59_01083 [Legionella massiliensis]CEE12545.1 hypothetical protein BN1094_01083 [Legionella massiliensis]
MPKKCPVDLALSPNQDRQIDFSSSSPSSNGSVLSDECLNELGA